MPIAVRALVACGWLTPADAGDPALTIDSLARSHVVSRVTAPDGRAVVVKHPAEGSVAAGRDLLRELFVYRLGGWIPALAAVLPRALLIDEGRQVLVIELLSSGGDRLWPALADAAGVTNADTAARLGSAMARWHAATRDVPMRPSLAEGIMHLPDFLEEVIISRSLSGQAFLRHLVADDRCAAALREAREAYRPQCLIHGDIRADNWLLATDGTGTALKVIDWEMAGAGDPAWDVASVLAEAVLADVRRGGPVELDESGWPPAVAPVATAFLRAYAGAGGQPVDGATLALFAAARLMHVASEWAEVGVQEDAEGATVVLDRARHLVAHRARAADTVEAWARW